MVRLSYRRRPAAAARRVHQRAGNDESPQHGGYGIRADKWDVGTLFERLVGWSLRSAATALLVGGVALLVAAVPAWPLTAETEAPRAIVVILAQMGALLVWAGAAANYLLRRRAPLLPNERTTVADDQRPALGGELVMLALVLIGAPIWLVVRLQPFLCRRRAGEPRNLAVAEHRWVRLHELTDFRFPPANASLIEEVMHMFGQRARDNSGA